MQIQLACSFVNFDIGLKDEDGKDEGTQDSSKVLPAITDEIASEIFDKLSKMQGKKTYYAKKNWTDEEAQLL